MDENTIKLINLVITDSYRETFAIQRNFEKKLDDIVEYCKRQGKNVEIALDATTETAKLVFANEGVCL
jgi:hypothetical protein